MKITNAHSYFGEVFSQILGHSLGQRRDQDALFSLRACPALFEEMIDLALDRQDFDLRIHQAGWPYDLFDNLTTDLG